MLLFFKKDNLNLNNNIFCITNKGRMSCFLGFLPDIFFYVIIKSSLLILTFFFFFFVPQVFGCICQHELDFSKSRYAGWFGLVVTQSWNRHATKLASLWGIERTLLHCFAYFIVGQYKVVFWCVFLWENFFFWSLINYKFSNSLSPYSWAVIKHIVGGSS